MKTRMLLCASAALLAACGEETHPARVQDEVVFDTYGLFVYASTSEQGAARTGHST